MLWQATVFRYVVVTRRQSRWAFPPCGHGHIGDTRRRRGQRLVRRAAHWHTMSPSRCLLRDGRSMQRQRRHRWRPPGSLVPVIRLEVALPNQPPFVYVSVRVRVR